jgi:hypothetical protein
VGVGAGASVGVGAGASVGVGAGASVGVGVGVGVAKIIVNGSAGGCSRPLCGDAAATPAKITSKANVGTMALNATAVSRLAALMLSPSLESVPSGPPHYRRG